ncbi:MAG: GH3 auxin-responsive promoter family protein, partial [bacterium]
MQYREIYNASEGFFGSQYGKDDDGMLLLLDNGVYYEFLPMSEIDNPN